MKYGTWEQSTFWSEEHLANPSVSQDSAKDSTTREVDSCLHFLRSLNVSGLDGLSGKMSPASCHQTEEGILEPSLGRWGTWGMGGPTGCLTHSGSEWPRDAAVCSLSDVLEAGPLPQRFYLSQKACAGILRRAEKRGKELPPMLREALEAVAGRRELPQPCEKKTEAPATLTKTFSHKGGANLVPAAIAYDTQNAAAIGIQVGALQKEGGGPGRGSCGFAVFAPEIVGTLSDGAHQGGA